MIAIKRSYTESVSWLFLACSFLAVLLPSGRFFGINLKIISFFFLLFFIGIKSYIFSDFLKRLNFVILLLIIWVFVGLVYWQGDLSPVFSQAKDIFVTAVFPIIGKILLQRNMLTAERLLRSATVWLFVIALIKIFIFIFSFVAGVPVYVVMEGISEFFGTSLMSFDLGDLGGRIQFVSDLLIPFVIFYILSLKKNRNRFDFFVLFSLIFSALVGFSRYVWVVVAVSVFLSNFLVLRKRKGFAIFIFIILFSCVFYFFEKEYIDYVFLQRFDSVASSESDLVRQEQSRNLWAWFWDAPLMGHGLGAYIPGYIRSEEAPYSYELQLLALLGQMGIIGVGFLSIAAISLYWRQFLMALRSNLMDAVAIFVLSVFWIMSGLYNPYLFSSSAGVIYTVIFALYFYISFECRSKGGVSDYLNIKSI